MINILVPICSFPATTALVAGTPRALASLSAEISELSASQFFESPFDALEAITENRHRISHDFDVSEHSGIAAIHQEVYNPERFRETTSVVVNYDMAGMNGLEFCERLANKAIKKFLIVEPTEEKLEATALSKGSIDRYVVTGEPFVESQIRNGIDQLQRQYFHEMSNTVIQMLSIEPPQNIQDPDFAVFLKDVLTQYNIVEFYLLDQAGRFLLLDSDATMYCIHGDVIVQQEELNDFNQQAVLSFNAFAPAGPI